MPAPPLIEGPTLKNMDSLSQRWWHVCHMTIPYTGTITPRCISSWKKYRLHGFNQALPACQGGHSAYDALTSQYAGRDKWEAEIRHQDDSLHNHVWKGQSNLVYSPTLKCFVSMQQCAEHILFQLLQFIFSPEEKCWVVDKPNWPGSMTQNQ